MPEGDTLHRAARRLQVLVGETIEADAPHPRGAAVARRIDGRCLLSARAVGKNLLLEFDEGVVVRSHLRMKGRWSVVPRGSQRVGRPWLVLRGDAHEAVLWHGPVLEVEGLRQSPQGPDILAESPGFDQMVANLRRTDQRRPIGEALLDQKLVAGIGNLWRSEALWQARLSPWRRLANVSEEGLLEVLGQAARLMRRSLEGERGRRVVYRRSGRPCPRCGTPIRSRGQGEQNRIAYWCASCQP
jgi:endonuclease VIII